MTKFGLELVDRIKSSDEAKLGLLKGLRKLSSDVNRAKTARSNALQCYDLTTVKSRTLNIPNRIQLLSLEAKSYGATSQQNKRALDVLTKSVKTVMKSLDLIRTKLGCDKP